MTSYWQKNAGNPRFLSTRWSIVLAAKGEDREAANALETLCQSYWYPLYAFARRKGLAGDAAQDATQSFFAHLLDQQKIVRADPKRGRFRSFLLTAFQHFLSNEHAKAAAAKRGGKCTILSLSSDPEKKYGDEPYHNDTPERAFEKSWALALIERVLQRLRAESDQAGKPDRFDRYCQHLVGSDQSRCRDLAEALGLSESAVKTALHRLRKRFGDLLREEIAETVDDPADVDQELCELLVTFRS